MKQRKEAEGGGGGWEAPVIEGLMSEGKGYKRGEVALRRLSSVGKSNQLSDAYNSSKIFDDVDTASERNENSGTQSQHEIQTHQPTQTGFRNQSDRFAIRTPFSLPTPGATLPLPQLLQCEWLTELRDYLHTLPSSSRLVSIVSSDYKYREVLLNWLLTARVKASKPLSNVLVLSLDQSLHQLLRSKDIACVHIPTTCLLRPGLRLTKHVAFTQVHIMRVLAMRLLNHWGYDVANYDSDALILKNPEPRFAELSDYHLIGSVGHFPKEMDRKWGTAVCIGVVLTRATPQTGQNPPLPHPPPHPPPHPGRVWPVHRLRSGLSSHSPSAESYWETLSGVIPDNTNDQARLNWALDAMQMVWDNPHSDMTVHTMQGQGRGQFRAAVLPARDVCRQSCTKKMIRVCVQ